MPPSGTHFFKKSSKKFTDVIDSGKQEVYNIEVENGFAKEGLL